MSLERHGSRHLQVGIVGSPCPRCGAAIKVGRKFCSQCGSPVIAAAVAPPARVARRVSVCFECGSESHHSDRFCKNCGGLLLPPTEPDTLRLHGNGEPARSSKGIDVPAFGAPNRTCAGFDSIGHSSLLGADQVLSSPKAPENSVKAQPGPGSSPASPAEPSELPEAGEAGAGLLRSRKVGVGAGVAALGFLIPVGILLSLRHNSSRGRGHDAALSGALLAKSSSSETEAPVAAAESTRQAGHPRKTERPSQALVGKTKSGDSANSHGEIATANMASTSTASPTPAGVRLPGPDLPPGLATIPEPGATDLSMLKPLGLNALPEPPRGPHATERVEVLYPVATAKLTNPLRSSEAVGPVPAAAAKANPPQFRSGGVVQPAKLIVRTLPAYPTLALQRHVAGTVHLNASVRKDGTVTDLKLTSGDLFLTGATMDAVRHWRYQPATLDGQPIDSRVDIEVKFQIPE